jgi:hypothetical protein
MKLITQIANSKFEKASSITLLHDIFYLIFNQFNYREVLKIAPNFLTKIFFCFEESIGAMLATGSLVYPNAEGSFPSEYYFGFKVPEELKNQKMVELGKLAKWSKLIPEGYEKVPYLSILLAIKEYSKIHNIEAWVGTVHPKLLDDIQNEIGIPVTILANKVPVHNEITDLMGDYPNEVFFIYATMKDSFEALEKFEYLIKKGIITIEIKEPTPCFEES